MRNDMTPAAFARDQLDRARPQPVPGGGVNALPLRKVHPSRSKLTRKFARKHLKKAGLL